MEKPYEGFGSLIFGEQEMRDSLPDPIYKQWKKTVSNEDVLDRPTADAIAHAMKRWAMDKGVTHFTHWFQPMTGGTAEKHDAFIEPGADGQPIARFSGKMLIKGESDASSFPSGGIRSTFEARGYTYWDVSSPVFIRENVLCIPTVFVSYTGEALDTKEPLLNSLKALSTAATRVANMLGEKDVRSCSVSVGLEQEYFLIDREYFEKRWDLKMTGRTLFGMHSTKRQELDDHYFGSIPDRVQEYMTDVNKQLWKLGIYAKTEHNEAAPAQFELAPLYSEGNIAVDQNQLIMDILKKTAKKHNLACLLHEKPFEGINGSGKHNNFSIVTDTGVNLFDPGKKPGDNIRFLTFVCAFIKAVDEYPTLLRMSASCTGNDHRLGANEAPPAIISIFLGSYIEDILYSVYKKKDAKRKKTTVDNGKWDPVSGLAYMPHDNSDRNRTSPVAFTGNKFEFRMLGSSMSASLTNTVLSGIMAESLNEIADELEGIKYLADARDKALEICRKIIGDHKRILFSGDGYSDAWVKEAARRGLPNVRSFIESVDILRDPKVVKMFTSLGIYSETELEANRKIMCEQYCRVMDIEIRTMIEMTRKDILPAMTSEYKFYEEVVKKPKFVETRLAQLSELIDSTYDSLDQMTTLWKEANNEADDAACGKKIYYDVVPVMEQLRSHVDRYEEIASREFYKLPLYEEMLFNL